MKPTSPTPHDPLDELLAAAVHGELTAAQRAELDALLQHDPAARAAYQEIQTMHDLLEKNHREVKPDPNFEDRMISGVKRKVRQEAQRETAWESALLLWRGVVSTLRRPSWATYVAATAIVLILAGVTLGPITRNPWKARQVAMAQAQRQLEEVDAKVMSVAARENSPSGFGMKVPSSVLSPAVVAAPYAFHSPSAAPAMPPPVTTTSSSSWNVYHGGTTLNAGGLAFQSKAAQQNADLDQLTNSAQKRLDQPSLADASSAPGRRAQSMGDARSYSTENIAAQGGIPASIPPAATDGVDLSPLTGAAPASTTTPAPTRKLVRDATLDLEVKDYQPTVDTITDLAKTDGGYLDSSSSQRGGNGKLQGTVVAKVAPDQLDAFLLKLRALGTLKNQSVSTEDVTKDYVDTQARLTTSRQMETQLQELLKRDTSKVADLLQVERELGRVRTEIEQMQGQLKLYDFQVQYATVTISVAEKDLNKTAAYLLQEHDQFALFVHDVEDAFAQAKAAADTYKAQILNADLEHGSDNTMNATLAFSVPSEQVDAFLAKVKGLGRVDNFTRTTTRVANDGGTSDEPADETRTDRDRAQVQLTIRADDESPRQQTQLAIASTGDIDAQAQQLKESAAADGATITASSFERETDGTETAALTFRLALGKVNDFLPALEKLGRVESLSVHRDDQPGEAAADASAPAEISLNLHNVAAVNFENEPPRQETQLAIRSAGNVDAQAQQVKSDAAKNSATVTASTFSHAPDGAEEAALSFRLPLTQAADFTATLEKLGKVESLAIQRNDVAGPNSTDPNAPAEISLTLRSEPAAVADNRGFGPTMRHLFGGGVTAFFQSVTTIGVLAAFLAPWLAMAGLLAFVARRLYVGWRQRQAAA